MNTVFQDYALFPHMTVAENVGYGLMVRKISKTLPHVVLPNLATALLAGGILAFALSFDEIVVTTFHGREPTHDADLDLRTALRPQQRPVTNVAAILVIVVTFIPVLVAQLLTREELPSGL